jgi:hypothetical protein
MTKCYILGCPYEAIIPAGVVTTIMGVISLTFLPHILKKDKNDDDCDTIKRNVIISLVIMIITWIFVSKKCREFESKLRNKVP